MTTAITTALERTAAAANTTLAAGYGGSATWTDMLFNFFYDWKWWAAIGSVVVLCTAGIFSLGRARLAGVLLIIGGLFLGVFFARIEHFIHITQNTEQNWEKPAQNGNPFNRT
ncbi:hypothetical protein [Mycolicibacterium llatzerense]|uniref:hypothetical protein n=1 Tax=Mycolicibacterium llatzerense TaxID=280871 RepID=UPI0008DE4F0E|nr:hypothetical protein [Mycolicibacterium llatzerense]